MDDILGDGGKAKFDPETNILTLNDPVIRGTYNDSKINVNTRIILKGSYHMTEKESTYGLLSYDYITFMGDFTFMGSERGVNGRRYTTLESGSLKQSAVH